VCVYAFFISHVVCFALERIFQMSHAPLMNEVMPLCFWNKKEIESGINHAKLWLKSKTISTYKIMQARLYKKTYEREVTLPSLSYIKPFKLLGTGVYCL
jgi:hypothetical protein